MVLEKTLESPLDCKEIKSVIKEISPEYLLEGLMLKLQLQHFGHLMWKTDSFEKTLMLGKTEGRMRRGWQRMRRLDAITNSISSVAQSCLTLGKPMNCSTPGFPVHHELPELTKTHVHRVSNAIQPSHPLSSPSPPTFNLSQHQGLFQWVSSSHQVAKVLEFQLQHQSFQ